ncbi:Ni/Fe hydrogenase 1 b-type cytochrome subunit [Altererythrobacter sp. B11]|uniref:cytochrome b/b6 domain-containing protein n=1 Tax=Altererythrobacter sp. B11 TaxID=2060312 RepID=UPI000DC6DB6E|nr:cytochrome b/b6 domain-containing protein [Altererythrobacter sp. B11]BBC73852.1 Ni/Fe hydrogenase 1 b-type cytochrome subunit [Altererythrobacter sp. B11]
MRPQDPPADWDIVTRLFHWLLVALLAFSWWSGEQHEMEWHRYSGYGILFLIVFRIYWGFAGSRTARFGSFLRSPAAVGAYARALARGAPPASAGHNPLGGWSVIAMLAALFAMVGAGLFAVDVDGFESGPLADLVSFDQGRAAAEVHEVIFNGLLALVALHILAILFYLLRFRRNLVRPMIAGRAAGGSVSAGGLFLRLLAGIAAAGAITWIIVNAAQMLA